MDIALINIEDGVNGYVDLVNHVLEHGQEVSPRGMKTLEIEDAVIRIHDVYNTLPLNIGRGAVPGIGAVEACQLLGGVSTPELVIAVGPQFKNYAEDNGLFHGAYGLRTGGQYDKVIERLKADPDTRQAVVTIWNPEFDLLPSKRDYPCTILHQFRVRDNKLNMSVYMRSNDVWLGAAYDFFQFTRVQLAVASVLGVEPGSYNHHVGSLHIYEQHWSTADRLEKTEKYERIPYFTGSSWTEINESAQRALAAAEHEHFDAIHTSLTPAEHWYASAMNESIRRNKAKED